MIEPTVGRVVLFHPHVDDGGDINGQPHAAFVAHVHNVRLINLAVFNENGSRYAKTSIKLLQDDDAAPIEGGYAEWMPFQKGQAAKHDAPPAPAIDLKPLDEKIAAVETSTAKQFQEMGDWLTKTLAEIHGKIDALPAAHGGPATPESGAGAAPGAAAEAVS